VVNAVDDSRGALEDCIMPEPALARLLLLAHRSLGGELLEELNERGYEDVRPGDAALFMTIDRRTGTRLTELARRARMTKQGMMLLVDELEERGYVRRVADPEDGRAKLVKLTARGRNYVAEARRAMAAVESRARRQLGYRRYASFRTALEALVGEESLDEE
jgi:DNA-binding MarR family transcriptional regulator